jgi:hypothetical protein
MAIHDWTLVGAGIFHHFHHAWIGDLTRTLNAGLLPGGYYALAEQIAGGLGPDVLALEGPPDANSTGAASQNGGGIAVAVSPPKTRFHARAEIDQYAVKANAVVVRHASHHRVVAVVEIVSPGNKSSRPALGNFVEKADELIRAGVHLLVLDLFPPGPHDPQGIHNIIWKQFGEERFVVPAGSPLTLASYVAGPCPEAFVEPASVGGRLTDMPLFLATDWYVQVPLETTYQSAWQAVPSIWREALEGRRAPG